MKYFAIRLIDALLIAGLLSGIASFATFSLIIIGCMVILMVLGSIIMTEELARNLADKSTLKKLVSYVVAAAYVIGLIFSDHPAWAAAYFISVTWIYAHAFVTLKEAGK